MAKYKFTATLDCKSLDKLADDLKKYREDTLEKKLIRFFDELADEGILVAYQKVESSGVNGTSKYTKYIIFHKRMKIEGNDVVVGQMIGEGQMQGDLKPLSMVEWGSAVYALEPSSQFGGFGGKGTFTTTGNNVDKERWVYFDKEKGKWRTNYSVKPTQPMFNAATQMIAQCENIAKRVFG